jgi:hypothetical protein
LVVYANGYAETKGSHVSVGVAVLKGKYDGLLKWPFVGVVRVSLLNHLLDLSHHNDTDQCNASVGEGNKILSIPHNALPYNRFQGTQYLEDDTLYFRVSVNLNDHKPWLECIVK